VTGELHLGHALTATIEDIMIRWHRMAGDPTLWLPGTDHAGIHGQYVVERELARHDLSRQEIGREEFLKHAWAWMRKYIPIIREQHKRLGASADWSRERFTMDPGPARAVRVVFKHLFDKGLIYRGERIINWCPRCHTSLSDLEVENEEEQGSLWTLRYPFADDPNDGILVATTRPETMLGDTGVAVNPAHPRWAQHIGRTVILPLMGRPIPIVGDEAAEIAFGTGAVKVTPGHDPLDFDIGQRHGLEIINLLNPDATMNENAGRFAGLHVNEARDQVVAALQDGGYLVKIEDYTHQVPHCERCKTVLEPMISKQWFVRMAPMAAPAITAARDGTIRFVPERFTKVFLYWLENIRDWCISRQLWWGHRIPVWYCANGHVFSSDAPADEVTACAECGGTEIEQDPDVLDTWFSSGLWPFSTLGWPEETEDFKTFYPTSVMETGYDILFFWVARMIMQGLENTGTLPFHTVYLHGLVRDEIGRKMSKSLGNTVNPLVAADKFGTDALRFNLMTGSTPGNDMKFSEARLQGMQHFANKLWNATRFIVGAGAADEGSGIRDQGSGTHENDPKSKIQNPKLPTLPPQERWTLADRWIISRAHDVNADVQRLMEDFQFGQAGQLIYDFAWSEFCDWYIEYAKGPLNEGGQAREDALAVLRWTLDRTLRLLHPYMPFLTEELWQHLLGWPSEQEGLDPWQQSIMVAPWPDAGEAPADAAAERDFGLLMDAITAIRNARAEAIAGAPEAQKRDLARKRLPASIGAGRQTDLFTAYTPMLARLALLDPAQITITPALAGDGGDGLKHLVVGEVALALPLADLIDRDAERARLGGEVAQAEGEIARLEKMLANEQFVTRAKPEVVARERDRLQAARDRLATLQERLAALR
jgi:valyl-tRNA synthetase